MKYEKIPSYLKCARIIALSKSNTSYPQIGEIRTIAILPAFSKLIERIINKQILEIVNTQNLLNESQRGFKSKISTLSNIRDLISETRLAVAN